MDMEPLAELLRNMVREEVLRALREQAGTGVEYLTTAEAASFAKVVPATIRAWIRKGRLASHAAGREVRVRRTDLEALMSGSRHVQPERVLSPEAQAQRDFRVARR